jgi:hypothetical protein
MISVGVLGTGPQSMGSTAFWKKNRGKKDEFVISKVNT